MPASPCKIRDVATTDLAVTFWAWWGEGLRIINSKWQVKKRMLINNFYGLAKSDAAMPPINRALSLRVNHLLNVLSAWGNMSNVDMSNVDMSNVGLSMWRVWAFTKSRLQNSKLQQSEDTKARILLLSAKTSKHGTEAGGPAKKGLKEA